MADTDSNGEWYAKWNETIPVPEFQLQSMTDGFSSQEIELSRSEYIELKKHLALLRGANPHDVRTD